MKKLALVAAVLLTATCAPPAHADPGVVPAARQAIGSPYAWGATGPRAFDCSGLVVWAYKQAGITVPRTSQALATHGTPVARDQLQPGDVVTFYPNASHAAIYTGDGMVIHASTYGHPVAEVPMAQAGPWHSAARY